MGNINNEKADNSYNEINFGKITTTKNVKPLKAIIFIILIFVIWQYAYLIFIGVLHVPKWYLIVNFRFNQNHFERIVDSDFEKCTNYSGEIESYISNIDDEKLQKSMRSVFNATWAKMTKEDYKHCCLFEAYCYDYKIDRGIMYYDGDDVLPSVYRITAGSYCYFEPLGKGWYYYEKVDDALI